MRPSPRFQVLGGQRPHQAKKQQSTNDPETHGLFFIFINRVTISETWQISISPAMGKGNSLLTLYLLLYCAIYRARIKKVAKKKGFQFIMTTVLGGLLFLVPVVFQGFVLAKAVGFMMIIAEPMADWIPVDTVGGVALANLIAIAAVIVVCFLAGLVARNALASGVVKNLESRVLMKIPGYTVIRGIKSGFDKDDNNQFKPVALALGSAERIGFEIQKLADGRSMIYIDMDSELTNCWRQKLATNPHPAVKNRPKARTKLLMIDGIGAGGASSRITFQWCS
jgi:hypothetical protein